MSLKSHIVDAFSKRTARVLPEGQLLVGVIPCPPMLPQKCKVFSQFLTDDGLKTGSDNLGIDGSVTSVNYWIPASDDNDIYITKLNYIVGYSASGELWEFADSGAALTNGVRVFYVDTHGDEVEIANHKMNSSFLRYALSDGLLPTAWEIRHLGANGDYGFLFAIDLARIMPPVGVKLDRGTNQKLSITIRDDCRDADDFNCCALGFERFQ